MRIIITGSRNWEGPAAEAKVHEILNAVQFLAEALGSPLTVVHGDCPTGADAIADRWARRRDLEGVRLEPWPADWEKYGKPAEFIRNGDMGRRGADLCVGFLRDNSKGTSNMINTARLKGIPTHVIPWEQI